jgi:hypothetical protein
VLADAGTATPRFVADAPGEYFVALVVSDAWSSSDPDTVFVSFTNLAPVASAGDNQTALLGETVVFDGSASSDPNGDLLSYRWSLVSAPPGSSASLANDTSAQSSLTSDRPGAYVVSLVVSDGLLDSSPVNVTLMAVSQADQAIELLRQAIEAVNALPGSHFKNHHMRNALTNKLQAVIADVEDERYFHALAKLRHDVLDKTDGCAERGTPKANDWIRKCTSQARLDPILRAAIALLEEIAVTPDHPCRRSRHRDRW